MKFSKKLALVAIASATLLTGFSVNAASLVSGSAYCDIGNNKATAKVNTDAAVTKFHFVIFRPASSSISSEQWGGFSQQITYSKSVDNISYGDKLLIWDDRYTMYETITCNGSNLNP